MIYRLQALAVLLNALERRWLQAIQEIQVETRYACHNCRVFEQELRMHAGFIVIMRVKYHINTDGVTNLRIEIE